MLVYFRQDYDSNMFRLQPADTVASSGPDMGGWQRLGRADQVNARREHPSPKAWQSQRLRSPSILPVTSRARLLRSTKRYVDLYLNLEELA